MLDGELGEAKALAMKLVAALGDVFGAKRTVRVKSVQISGVSYKTIGDHGLEFVVDLRDKGGKFSVPSTINPAGMDLENWRRMGVPEWFAKKQLRIISALKDMGARVTCTCTPYLVGNKPKFGDHVAWAESSAVVFANSVLGARTNREGAPSSLASAIVGRTAMYGMHLKPERSPTHLVKVETRIRNELEFSLLGYVIGEKVAKGVPFIFKFKGNCTSDNLKALGAGMATSGSIALFHLEERTPEAKKIGEKKLKGLEKISIEERDIEEVKGRLGAEGPSTHVFLGCPHLSLRELKAIASILKGKELKEKIWCFTSRKIYGSAVKLGYVKEIEEAGGVVVKDTCMVVCPLERLGISNVRVNSAKAAYYLSSLSGLKPRLCSLKEIGG